MKSHHTLQPKLSTLVQTLAKTTDYLTTDTKRMHPTLTLNHGLLFTISTCMRGFRINGVRLRNRSQQHSLSQSIADFQNYFSHLLYFGHWTETPYYEKHAQLFFFSVLGVSVVSIQFVYQYELFFVIVFIGTEILVIHLLL